MEFLVGKAAKPTDSIASEMPGVLRQLSSQLAALRDRVAVLESQVSGQSFSLCPVCSAPGFKRTASAPHPQLGDIGLVLDTSQCPSCGHAEQHPRLRDA